MHPSGALVPCLEDQFRSLAFHALYHDGYDSGLPADRAASGDGPLEGNRYASELGRLARELGLHIPLTLEDLDSYLDNELIHSRGFKTLVCEVLDQQQIANGTRYLRGGNWGKGPYPSSGGPPHTAIVVVDPSPTPPPEQAKAIHPGLENGRALELKEAIRHWWNERQPDAERCNVLHTSDSAAEAVHYVDVLFLERAEKLVDAAHAIAMGSLPPG